jgi:hypothetical protein
MLVSLPSSDVEAEVLEAVAFWWNSVSKLLFEFS